MQEQVWRQNASLLAAAGSQDRDPVQELGQERRLGTSIELELTVQSQQYQESTVGMPVENCGPSVTCFDGCRFLVVSETFLWRLSSQSREAVFCDDTSGRRGQGILDTKMKPCMATTARVNRRIASSCSRHLVLRHLRCSLRLARWALLQSGTDFDFEKSCQVGDAPL